MRSLRRMCFCVLAFLSLAGLGVAGPVSELQVRRAVSVWLQHTPRPLKAELAKFITKVRPVVDPDGTVLFSVVSFQGGGFAVVSSDDELEPVVAFSASGGEDPLPEGSPLLDILRSDLRGRMARLRTRPASDAVGSMRNSKWQKLLSEDREQDSTRNAPAVEAASTEKLDDPRVDMLVQSQWHQLDAGGGRCFNYYTPNNYYSGCHATALGQIMRYHRYPTQGIGVKNVYYQVNGGYQVGKTRGGDGAGGPYNWDQMPLRLPAGSVVPESERAMIGALLWDVGATLGMMYGPDVSISSSAPFNALLFKERFPYSNINVMVFVGGLSESQMASIFHPNLDAGFPVEMFICVTAPSGIHSGHAVVLDGYGYNLGTLYRHVNLGWLGAEDAWYNLPKVGAGDYFNTVNGAWFNIYPTGTGEILSGRVLDSDGRPLDGAQVSAGSTSATTNARGIYALRVPAGTYTLTATKAGYVFPPRTGEVVNATVDQSVIGNRWGMDFQAVNATTLAVTPGKASLLVGSSMTFTANVQNASNPDVTWSLSGPGTISATVGRAITYSAPASPGQATLTVTSQANPLLSAQVVIRIKGYDLNGDGAANVLDLAVLAGKYGQGDDLADLNGDGVVDDADFALWVKGF